MLRNFVNTVTSLFSKSTSQAPTMELVIPEHQKSYGSWSVILTSCLTSNAVAVADCSDIYTEFKNQEAFLKQQEDAYLDSVNRARDENLKHFDEVFEKSVMPMHLPEASQKLKSETLALTEKYLSSKRDFEIFKRGKLKGIVDPVSHKLAAKDFGLSRANIEIFQSLSGDLQKTESLINHVDACLKHNKTAEYLTEKEFKNNQLSEFPSYQSPSLGP